MVLSTRSQRINKKFGFLFFYPIRRYVDISPYFASHLISSTQCCPVVCVP